MRYLSLLAAVIAVAFSSCNQAKKNEPQYLFVLHAKSGRYSNGKLMLEGVDQNVAYFTDRPVRKAGTFTVATFLKSWTKGVKNNFHDNPPNAGLVSSERNKADYSEESIELKSPVYDASRDALVFDIKFLNQKVLREGEQLSDVVLFIDFSSNPAAACIQGDAAYKNYCMNSKQQEQVLIAQS